MFKRYQHAFLFDDSQLKLYGLATLTGLVAGGVTTLFRYLIEHGQMWLFQSDTIESFSTLPWYWIVGLPIIGSLLIALLFSGLKPEERSVGAVHVIARLAYHEGRLPWSNAIRQFLGAAIALVSGHSVGREGPSIHLGAASGSLIGANLGLPNNWLRILVASGSAAAIAASFNTPIAGVIFAMEVIMMEYHIATFIPVILASVSGAIISRLTFGEAPFFGNVTSELQSLWEIPYIIFLGIIIGLLATAFIKSLSFFSTLYLNKPLWQRTLMAGVMVGLAGLIMPDVMGMSYHMTNTLHIEQLAFFSLLSLVILKLVLSTAAIGLGIPGGFIGPSIVVGAAAGAALGIIGQTLLPDYSSSTGLYAMIGMCAMMAATLKAPLAALLALLELTGNPHIILPGMLAIVFSSFIVTDLFKFDSIMLILLKARGLDYKNDPISQTLRRISVAKAMERSFAILPSVADRKEVNKALANNPIWIIIEDDGTPNYLLPAADLARAVIDDSLDKIDLKSIPANRKDLYKIPLHYSLQEARETLTAQAAEALYVTRMTAPMIEHTYGVLTSETIESYYQTPK